MSVNKIISGIIIFVVGGIILAVLTGIGVLAFKHPKRYKSFIRYVAPTVTIMFAFWFVGGFLMLTADVFNLTNLPIKYPTGQLTVFKDEFVSTIHVMKFTLWLIGVYVIAAISAIALWFLPEVLGND